MADGHCALKPKKPIMSGEMNCMIFICCACAGSVAGMVVKRMLMYCEIM